MFKLLQQNIEIKKRKRKESLGWVYCALKSDLFPSLIRVLHNGATLKHL
jgi:hypothetical protein